MNKDREQFGDARLTDLLKRYARTSATEIIEIVTESVREFTRGCEQEDDMTMVVVKMLEPRARPARTARSDLPEFAEFTPGKPQVARPPPGGANRRPPGVVSPLKPSTGAGQATSPGAPQAPGETGDDTPEWLK